MAMGGWFEYGNTKSNTVRRYDILWVEEILHHLGWLKPFKWDKPAISIMALHTVTQSTILQKKNVSLVVRCFFSEGIHASQKLDPRGFGS